MAGATYKELEQGQKAYLMRDEKVLKFHGISSGFGSAVVFGFVYLIQCLCSANFNNFWMPYHININITILYSDKQVRVTGVHKTSIHSSEDRYCQQS